MQHGVRSGFAVLLLCGAAAAQSALHPGDVAVVTTDGLWLIRPPSTTEQLLLPAASFGGLVAPSVEWRPGTDEFLLCSGDRLWRVTVSGSPPSATLADITPAGVAGANFRDLEIHAVDGRLALIDATQSSLLRYAPPFAAGMAPDLVLPLLPGPRALASDSRDWPPRFVVGYSNSVMNHDLQGGATLAASTGVNGLDQGRQEGGLTVAVRSSENSIIALVGTSSVVVEINLLWNLCGPVALRPADVEFDTATNRAMVFAQDGLNPQCMPGYSGGDHVVAFPLGQSQQAPPIVLTGSASSITGTAGDLALVWTDQAFAGTYGSAAAATALRLDSPHDPYPGQLGFELKLTQAPPGAPVLVLVGQVPADVALPGGQALLVSAPLLLFAGTTNAAGVLKVPAPLAAGSATGFDVRVQAFAAAGAKLASNGLLLHFAPP